MPKVTEVRMRTMIDGSRSATVIWKFSASLASVFGERAAVLEDEPDDERREEAEDAAEVGEGCPLHVLLVREGRSARVLGAAGCLGVSGSVMDVPFGGGARVSRGCADAGSGRR